MSRQLPHLSSPYSNPFHTQIPPSPPKNLRVIDNASPTVPPSKGPESVALNSLSHSLLHPSWILDLFQSWLLISPYPTFLQGVLSPTSLWQHFLALLIKNWIIFVDQQKFDQHFSSFPETTFTSFSILKQEIIQFLKVTLWGRSIHIQRSLIYLSCNT